MKEGLITNIDDLKEHIRSEISKELKIFIGRQVNGKNIHKIKKKIKAVLGKYFPNAVQVNALVDDLMTKIIYISDKEFGDKYKKMAEERIKKAVEETPNEKKDKEDIHEDEAMESKA